MGGTRVEKEFEAVTADLPSGINFTALLKKVGF